MSGQLNGSGTTVVQYVNFAEIYENGTDSEAQKAEGEHFAIFKQFLWEEDERVFTKRKLKSGFHF